VHIQKRARIESLVTALSVRGVSPTLTLASCDTPRNCDLEFGVLFAICQSRNHVNPSLVRKVHSFSYLLESEEDPRDAALLRPNLLPISHPLPASHPRTVSHPRSTSSFSFLASSL
jgi:hypothetical protein